MLLLLPFLFVLIPAILTALVMLLFASAIALYTLLFKGKAALINYPKKFWQRIFKISVITGYSILFYILFMPMPVKTGRCYWTDISPDKAYSATQCGARRTLGLFSDHLSTLELYDTKTGKLVFKDVFLSLDMSSFYWNCNKSNSYCGGVYYLEGSGGTELPPSWWNQFRAKIPLWW